MPVTNVRSRWSGGDLYFYDKSENEICHWDGTNRKFVFPSGSVIDLSAATGILSLAAGEIAQADIAAASLDGTVAKTVADVNVIGGLPVLHRIDVADDATGNVDVVLTHKTRVVDVWLVKTAGAGGADDTIQVKNGASAITDAMSINVADQAVVRAGSIDDATHEIAAAGTLRVTRTKASAANVACVVYVLGIRVA
jgi:hypothetical protein